MAFFFLQQYIVIFTRHFHSSTRIKQTILFTASHQTMQARPSLISPTRIFHPPAAKFPPPLASHPVLPPLKQRQTQAISISAPEIINVSTSKDAQGTDDSVAAFWDYQFLFVSQRTETAEPVQLRVVEGAIPSDFPSGTYYLTGPGLFSDDHGSTVHPLDGHGYLRAFLIDGVSGEAKFMARYVRTEAQVEEHDPATGRWRFTHRGPFSVLRGGKRFGNVKVMKNVANTSVLRWGGRLLCLWEGGDPYEIESGSLDTIGEFNVLDGGDLSENLEKKPKPVHGDPLDIAASLIKPILYGVFKMPPKRLLSHYKMDSQRNRLLTISCKAEDMLLPRSNFTFYEFDSNFKVLGKEEFEIPDHLMIHDWAFTDTHYILFANRIRLDIFGSMKAVCGMSPMISALAVNPSKATSPIYLLPRPRLPADHNNSLDLLPPRDWRVPVEAPSQKWLLHVGNAFQVTDGSGNLDIQIQACACSYHWFNFQKLFGYNWQSGKLDPSIMNVDGENEMLPHLVQISIKVDAKGSCRKCSVEPLNKFKKPSDFPVINPAFSGRKNKYIYAATSSGSRQALRHFPFDSVVQLDLVNQSSRSWSVGARRFIGEPIFVPRGTAEDDGYILVVEYAVSMQRCYLVILDPRKIGEGDAAIVAKLGIPKNLNFPLGFHGFWAGDIDL